MDEAGRQSVAQEYDVYATSKHLEGAVRPVFLPEALVGQAIPCDLFNAHGVLLLNSGAVLPDALQSFSGQTRVFCRGQDAALFGDENPVPKLRDIIGGLARIDRQLAEAAPVSATDLQKLALDLHTAWTTDPDACLGYTKLTCVDRPSICHAVHAALIAAELAAANRMHRDEIVEIIGGMLTMNIADHALHDHMHNLEGGLDVETAVQLQRHPIEGRRLLQKLGDFSDIWLDIVACHHENIDGSGYPRALRGVEIPVVARIARIADIFAARSRGRQSRSPFSWSLGKTRTPAHLAKHLFGRDLHYLDQALVNKFLQTLGRFPPGSLVRLDNSDWAVVTRRAGEAFATPPLVHAIRNYQGLMLDAPSPRRIGHREYRIRNYINEEGPQLLRYEWRLAWGY